MQSISSDKVFQKLMTPYPHGVNLILENTDFKDLEAQRRVTSLPFIDAASFVT